MDAKQSYSGSSHNKTIAELNEDCEILIRKEIEKCLINYVNSNNESGRGSLDINQICTELKMNSPEIRQLYLSPVNRLVRDRAPKMLTANSTTLSIAEPRHRSRISPRRSLVEPVKRYVDEPIQATDEKFTGIPRSTVLSRCRQHLSKRHSGAQSSEIKSRTVKTQTDNCAKTDVAITVEPLDFLGLYEKATNFPVGSLTGGTKEQATQMYDHITQSELFCIEWINKNLFAVQLNPNTLVVDDKIKDISETACLS